MADSMQRLVGLVGTNLANRRWNTPSGIGGSIAELGRPRVTSSNWASVVAARSAGVLPGSVGEGRSNRSRADVPAASIRPGFER